MQKFDWKQVNESYKTVAIVIAVYLIFRLITSWPGWYTVIFGSISLLAISYIITIGYYYFLQGITE